MYGKLIAQARQVKHDQPRAKHTKLPGLYLPLLNYGARKETDTVDSRGQTRHPAP